MARATPVQALPCLVSAPSAPVPSWEQARAWGQASLRFRDPGLPWDVVRRWQELMPVRRLRLPATGDPGELLEGAGHGIRVDWVVDLEAVDLLSEVSPALWREQGVVVWATPPSDSGEALVETVTRAGLAGWPVALEPTPGLLRGGEELLAILDFYLFHPGLSVPVEPLHSLLVGLMGGRPRRLWELWFGAPCDHFHVSAGGAVSLSAAWAAQDGLHYGDIEDTPEVWRASAPHVKLQALITGKILADPACAACEARPLCGGAIISLDPEARCEIWREVAARLRLAAASLTVGRSRHGGGSNPARRAP